MSIFFVYSNNTDIIFNLGNFKIFASLTAFLYAVKVDKDCAFNSKYK